MTKQEVIDILEDWLKMLTDACSEGNDTFNFIMKIKCHQLKGCIELIKKIDSL